MLVRFPSPVYKMFHDGEESLPKMKPLAVSEELSLWGEGPNEWKELLLLSKDLARMDDRKRSAAPEDGPEFGVASAERIGFRRSDGSIIITAKYMIQCRPVAEWQV